MKKSFLSALLTAGAVSLGACSNVESPKGIIITNQIKGIVMITLLHQLDSTQFNGLSFKKRRNKVDAALSDPAHKFTRYLNAITDRQGDYALTPLFSEPEHNENSENNFIRILNLMSEPGEGWLDSEDPANNEDPVNINDTITTPEYLKTVIWAAHEKNVTPEELVANSSDLSNDARACINAGESVIKNYSHEVELFYEKKLLS